jgi:hypothetical protein
VKDVPLSLGAVVWSLVVSEKTLTHKSGRPVYAIVLVALSTSFIAATVLPFLYSMLVPKEDIERIAALKDSGEAPLDAVGVVEQTKSAVGSLTKVI